MKKFVFIASILFFFLVFLLPAKAEESTSTLIVSPSIIDEKGKARDIFKYDIIFKNNTGQKINIYTLVDDITAENGAVEYDGPGTADVKISLANWILFKRASIELEPGEEKTEQLEIDVSLYAIPGKRYAQLVYAYGSDRPDAQAKRKSVNFPKTMLSIDVQDESVEKAQLTNFDADKKAFFKYPAGMHYAVKNTGNVEIEPSGYIYIYDRRGSEIAKLDANPDNKKIAANEEISFNQAWNEGSRFGKFKVKLELEYGSKDRRDIQDTIFFWMFPIKILVAIASGVVFLLVLLSILIFKKTYRPGAAVAEYVEPKKEKEGVVDLRK